MIRQKNQPLPDNLKGYFHSYPDPLVPEARYNRIYAAFPQIDPIINNADEYQNTAFSKLLLLGDPVVDELVKHPEYISSLLTPGFIHDPFSEIAIQPEDLRTYKMFVWMSLLLRDFMGLADLETTLRDFSVLADTIAREALHRIDETRLDIWALGKWGGWELNAASDIDPVFFRSADSGKFESDTPVRKWLKLLMPEGSLSVYPVDLRLRPEGQSGPLAFSYQASEQYFFQRAASWERIAWLRARPVTKEPPGWFKELMYTFLFPTSKDPKRSLQEAGNALEVVHSSAKERDLKKGIGGIRDIEFLVSGFQFAFARKIPGLRHGAVLNLLDILNDEGVLVSHKAVVLRESYRFYRRMENFLQAEADRGIFQVPLKGSVLHARLAFCMGYSPEEFETRFQGFRKIVAEIVENEIGGSDSEATTFYIDPQSDTLSERFDSLAATSGLQPVAEKMRNILRRLGGQWGSADILFDTAILLNSATPEDALVRLESAIHAFGGPSAWKNMFSAKKKMLLDITSIICHSPRISEEAIVQPELWLQLGKKEMPALPDTFDTIQHSNRLGAATFHLGTELLLFNNTLDFLTSNWSKAVDNTIGQLFQELESDVPVPISILAFGKWGSRELLPDADLDYFIVCDDVDAEQFAKLQIEVGKWRQRASLLGRLTLDDRLRPEGSTAPMVTSFSRLKEYIETRARGWERIAYSRVRAVAGAEELGKAAEKLCLRFASTPPESSEWTQIHNARKSALKLRRGAVIPLKKMRGGLMDYEFAAVFAAWKQGVVTPEWWQGTMTMKCDLLTEFSTDDRWKKAKEGYATLRLWEAAALFTGQSKGFVLPKTAEAAFVYRAFTGMEFEDLRAEWGWISELGKELYEESS
ncbi:hypothetical protein K8I28_01355 [bacterium]|nr:hypothetical protein [bacterium]